MILVIIESPFAGDTGENLEYLNRCILDSLQRGEAPIASHGLYPIEAGGPLDDALPDDRRIGIDAGLAWYRRADLIVFYADRGFSAGMRAAMAYAADRAARIEVRWIDTEGGP